MAGCASWMCCSAIRCPVFADESGVCHDRSRPNHPTSRRAVRAAELDFGRLFPAQLRDLGRGMPADGRAISSRRTLARRGPRAPCDRCSACFGRVRASGDRGQASAAGARRIGRSGANARIARPSRRYRNGLCPTRGRRSLCRTFCPLGPARRVHLFMVEPFGRRAASGAQRRCVGASRARRSDVSHALGKRACISRT